MTLKLSNLNRAARRVAAFTMVEIAICIGVIGFAMVAIIGILPIGLNVQRDNREVTLINFDANYLLNAIRSGARGQDELTNYVISITNYITLLDPTGARLNFGINWYTTNGSFNTPGTPFMTNGSNIIGLLSTPKYVPAKNGDFYSNFITADIRAISGSLVDQGTSQGSRDFAFTYRVFPELIPSSSYAFSNSAWQNYSTLVSAIPDPTGANSSNSMVGKDLQHNLSDLRLKFSWPVLGNGKVGNGHEVFRSAVSGTVTNYATVQGTLFYVQPQSFGYAP